MDAKLRPMQDARGPSPSHICAESLVSSSAASFSYSLSLSFLAPELIIGIRSSAASAEEKPLAWKTNPWRGTHTDTQTHHAHIFFFHLFIQLAARGQGSLRATKKPPNQQSHLFALQTSPLAAETFDVCTLVNRAAGWLTNFHRRKGRRKEDLVSEPRWAPFHSWAPCPPFSAWW